MKTPDISTGLASQGGHWYRADGSPAYEIRARNGKMRAVNLRDARKHGLFPSVTAILGCAHKPALEAWKVRQGILAALTLPRLEDETDTAFADRALTDSREQARKAAELGTTIHEQIDRSFREPIAFEWFAWVDPVRKWIAQTFPAVEFQAERSFASSAGYGGKVDLHARLPDGSGIVIDFKTKAFDNPETVRGWDEQGIQLAAYADGLGMDHAQRWNLFVSSTVPGLLVPWRWEDDSYPRHLAMFHALLAYWQADRQYTPGGNDD